LKFVFKYFTILVPFFHLPKLSGQVAKF